MYYDITKAFSEQTGITGEHSQEGPSSSDWGVRTHMRGDSALLCVWGRRYTGEKKILSDRHNMLFSYLEPIRTTSEAKEPCRLTR